MIVFTTKSQWADINPCSFHPVVVDWIKGEYVNWKNTMCISITLKKYAKLTIKSVGCLDMWSQLNL